MLKYLKRTIKKILPKIGYYLNKNLIDQSSPIGMHQIESIESSYKHFKKFFDKSVLFTQIEDIREYALKESITHLDKDDLIIEFGIYKGESINFFSNELIKFNKKNLIYGFDSFEGLEEDWSGNIDHPKEIFNLYNKTPRLNKNVKLIRGRVEETLEKFLETTNKKINFVHLDLDLYVPTKYVLKKIKYILKENAIIIFDQLYGYPGWENHEFRALKEVFEDSSYEYIAFGPKQVVIKIIK